MFTGIIEEIGEIVAIQKMTNGVRISVSAKKVLDDLKVDDSISIDGACQTVTGIQDRGFTVEAVGETLEKTTLARFRTGRKVNLERALTLQTRLGGHLVQGHVNGTGTVNKWIPRGENYYLEIELEPNLLHYCIAEGSIAVNGISLTIARLGSSSVGISIIPHTVKQTTLNHIKTGDPVNIETDVIAQYVERLLGDVSGKGLTPDKLKSWGY